MLYEDPPTDRQCPYGATPRSNGDGRGLVGEKGCGLAGKQERVYNIKKIQTVIFLLCLLFLGGGASAKGGGALGGRIQGFGSGNPSSPQSISQTFS